MNVRNKQPFDAGRAAYLTLNGLLLAFLLAPIAIVLVFALNPALHLLPAGRRQPALVREVLPQPEFMNALFLSCGWRAACWSCRS